MKALTEMKRRKQSALISQYSLPHKLHFSILAAHRTSSLFRTSTTITRKEEEPLSCSTPLTTPLSSSNDADSTMVVVSIPPPNNDKQTGAGSKPNCAVVATTMFVAPLHPPKQRAGGALRILPKKNTMRKSSKKVKKKVSFQEHDEIFGIASRQDISPEERREIWYSRAEYETILQACSKQINMLDRGKHLKDRKFCARGLESNTRVQAGTKTMNRYLAYQAVLCEQERQLRAGAAGLDENEIAQLYYATSYSCQLWARAVGLADQRVAQDIHDESEELLFSQLVYREGRGDVEWSSEESSSMYLSSSSAAAPRRNKCGAALQDAVLRIPPDEFVVARAA